MTATRKPVIVNSDIFGVRPKSESPSPPRKRFKVDFMFIYELMNGFTYKPNFRFEVLPNPGIPRGLLEGSPIEDVKIHVIMYVENSRTAFRPWSLERNMNGAFEEDFMYNQHHRVSYSPGVILSPRRELVPVSGTFTVPPDMDSEAMYWDWLFNYPIRDVERHEMAEWFKVDGKLMYDPHK